MIPSHVKLAIALVIMSAGPVASQVPAVDTVDTGRVMAGTLLAGYPGAVAGGAVGYLVDSGTGCWAAQCDFDGLLGAVVGGVAGTVVAPVLVSHLLNERQGNVLLNGLATGGITAGVLAVAFGTDLGREWMLWAVPALAGLTAGMTELATGRPPPRGDPVPPPPHPDAPHTHGPMKGYQ